MKIAILGCGLCGLATAFHLSQCADTQITLFDKAPLGQNTSGIAAGLLHCYIGARGKANWMGIEGVNATKRLIHVAEGALGYPVAMNLGIFRPAITMDQQSDFQKAAKLYSHDIHWQTKIQYDFHPSGIYSGIFLESGVLVDCPNYMKGLWKACSAASVQKIQTLVSSLSDLKDFDLIIVTAGAETLHLPELSHLPLTPIKGQILEFNWQKEWGDLPHPVNSHAYLLKTGMQGIIGATFEREFVSPKPDREFAALDLLPKIHQFFPGLSKNLLLDCRAGIRASTPDHRPLLLQAAEKTWVLTGMGSKGLLYHALYAERLKKLFNIYASKETLANLNFFL